MPRQARKESGTGICIRGHFEEYFYDEPGNKVDDMVNTNFSIAESKRVYN